ncbi:S-layer homology domain-containing protein [Aminipila butyrica]|uniref:S-layer homology domain-containing protein n=1 Tax=Aminipila butyrica TaxID=433296 RepID=A0A858BZA8_9FIRM|nr:S-layer homology domain-containing protein [Aminipila butyrica]QIB70458.1 S-layer homology domain-containing protein [Aminipila butyrica]
MKRAGFILLTVLVAAGMQSGVFAAERATDLPENWSKPAVEKALENGLLTPYEGKVYPERALTRAEMAAIINRTFGAAKEASLSGYSDVAQSKWYYSDMAKSLQMEAFTGSDGKMNPDRAITREEAFTVLARVFEIQAGDVTELNKFTDGSTVASWARGSIAAMVQAGYVGGAEGKLLPAKTITRAEFAQVMSNLADTFVGEAAANEAGTIDGNMVVSKPDTIIRNTTVSGDLILADGIGNGDVTLENVHISGRLVVRGGGSNTVKLVGSDIKGEVVVHNINHTVRIFSENTTDISQLRVKSDLILDANVSELTLTAPVRLEQRSGTVTNAMVADTGAGAQINVGTGAVIGTLSIEGENVKASGLGKLQQVRVQANNASITVPGAVVSVAKGVTGTAAGDTAVPGGTVATVGEKTATSTGGSGGSSGGSSGNNGNNGNNGNGNENPDNMTKTSGDWVGVSQTGIVDVDFLRYATISLNLDAMGTGNDFDVYTYYINGVKKEIEKDVTKVVSLPTQNRLIIKVLLDNNGADQELKLVRDKEYMIITLNGLGLSVKN